MIFRLVLQTGGILSWIHHLKQPALSILHLSFREAQEVYQRLKVECQLLRMFAVVAVWWSDSNLSCSSFVGRVI